MKKIHWGTGIIFLLVALLAFLVGLGIFGGWSCGGYGSHMGPGFLPFGWLGMGLGMLLLWLLPVGLVILAGLGIIWLVRGNAISSASRRVCPNCKRSASDDWQHCPYCGTQL